MITISNFGWRIGNQIFQIAAAQQLAKENGTEFLCPEWKYQKYFKHKFKKYSGEPIEKHFAEDGFHYKPIPFQDNLALAGYFQSYKYFSQGLIDEIFEFEDPMGPKSAIESLKNYASIHVRRGDYLHYPDHHPLCTLEYYKKAIELSGCKNFAVFSDDIEWCKRNFDFAFGDKVIFYYSDTVNDEMYDFRIMTYYGCNIISNSTFSWWAAMLNKNPDKLIITPSKDNWHGPAYGHWNHDDLLPESWKQIKF